MSRSTDLTDPYDDGCGCSDAGSDDNGEDNDDDDMMMMMIFLY
jgi:hypothetical protein